MLCCGWTAGDSLVYFNYPDFYVVPNRSGSVIWVDQKPAIAVRDSLWEGHSTPSSLAKLLNAQSRDAGSVDGYSVLAVHLWSQTVDTVAETVEALDKDGVVVVKLDELVRLMTVNVRREERVVAEITRHGRPVRTSSS